MRCGLLGEKLGHSYSKAIHERLGGYSYELIECPRAELDAFMKGGSFDAINVTIPYKKAVIPYCAALSPIAERIGSVNAVIRQRDGSLYGDNTDAYGFMSMVKKSGVDIAGKKAIVLGSGGASATICAVLNELNAKSVAVISRSGQDNYENIHKHADAEIIVNTTPVGMYPNTGVSPVDLSVFKGCKGVLDIVYNPHRTALLMQAEALGIPCMGGLNMLVAQAKRAAELFTVTAIPDSRTDEIERELSLNMQNSYSDHPEEPGDTDLPTKPAATSDILCRLSEAILDDLQKQMKPDFPKLTCIPEAKAGQEHDGESNSVSCQIKKVSSSMEAYSSPAYYLTPPIDDLWHNTIYLNEPNITDDLTLYTTLAHEGYPGHLYQTVYSQSFLNQQNASCIRSMLHYGGFVEGWAVYVENLSYGYAAQLTKNEEAAAYIEACRLNRNLHLCLYSYMDIAIHYDGATPEQIGRFLENLGLGQHTNVETIYEYLVEEPCNYLKYYLGYLEFLSLKQKAKEMWGTDYSDYRFHKFVLETGPSDFRSLGELVTAHPYPGQNFGNQS